jgi:histidinol-phosphate aminotransferase
MEKAIVHNDQWLAWLTGKLEGIGLKVTPSVANFLLIHFPDAQGNRAADADAALSAKGILLRRVAGYGFPNALRMSVGTEKENRQVIAALEAFMSKDGDAS